MPRISHSRTIAASWKRLCAGVLIAGSCLGAEPVPLAIPTDEDWRPTTAPDDMLAAPQLMEPGTTTIMPPACPPANIWSKLTRRVAPGSDLIGMPLHHRNFSADCYGENWRIQQFDLSTKSGRKRQRWHDHSLGMEHYFGWVFGKAPRGYIHDTSGHPMRGYFVPQPGDPTIPFEPGSDTLMPARMVVDYPLYEYRQGQSSACKAEDWGEHQDSPKVISPR